MGDLAGMLNCDNSNITGLVDRVAGHGLVIRGTHQGDRRVTRVALTQRGAEQVQRFRAELQGRLGERLSHWPRPPPAHRAHRRCRQRSRLTCWVS
jgi:DNA-binding MarR family transcriptional regulator